MTDLFDIRREYTQGHLDEKTAADHPLTQFHAWFEEFRATAPLEPTVMVLGVSPATGPLPFRSGLYLWSLAAKLCPSWATFPIRSPSSASMLRAPVDA